MPMSSCREATMSMITKRSLPSTALTRFPYAYTHRHRHKHTHTHTHTCTHTHTQSFLDADLKPLSPRSAPRLLLAADSNSGNSNSNNSNLNLNPPVEQTLVPAFTLPWAVETEVTLEQRMRDEGWLGGGGGGGGGWAPTASITGPSSIDTSDAQTRNYNTFSGSPVPSNADLHSVASALSSVQLPSSSTTPPPSPPPLAHGQTAVLASYLVWGVGVTVMM